MTIKLCRTFGFRNSSFITTLSNQSNITDAEWITNGISLIIFILAFIGNSAALVVMFGSRGPIRLTNNKYLANLACADLLRACFMPFTIIARMKRNFMFGPIICKILPIVQGLSVAVDVFTLVCISIERYLAICRPLLILKLQSINFSNILNGFILFSIWLLSLIIALPNLYIYNLCSLPKPGRFKCEKIASEEFDERIYMIAVDIFYFVIPVAVMIVLYTLIIWKMYRNSTAMRMRSFQNSIRSKTYSSSSSPPLRISLNKSYHSSDLNDPKQKQSLSFEKFSHRSSHHSSSSRSRSIFSDEEQEQNIQIDPTKQTFNRTCEILHPNYTTKPVIQHLNIRKINSENSTILSSHGLTRIDRHRRKALKLLITLIVEFFICWTPLFIYHTIGTFDKKFYRTMPTIFVDLILLFSFASASCNPLTYYFMSKRYRSVLYAYIPCYDINNNNKQQTKNLIKAFRSDQQQNITQTKRFNKK